MEEIIRTHALTKRYGDTKAVSDLSLSVRKGEIYGFIGLNGAGKTTTIRMLLGMISPSSGTLHIAGSTVSADQTKLWQKIGYMVEAPAHYPNLTVSENLELTRRLRLLPDRQSVDRIIVKLGLTRYTNVKAKNLSQGNQQRLGLAKALIHDPEILILDEPTNALDPAGIVEIRNLLTDLSRQNGVTVFVSSHILGEVARFSSRIGIIHDGCLITEMDTPELNRRCRKKLTIGVQDPQEALKILDETGISAGIDTHNLVQSTDDRAIEHPERITELLVKHHLSPFHIATEQEDLEAFFLRTISNTNNHESVPVNTVG